MEPNYFPIPRSNFIFCVKLKDIPKKSSNKKLFTEKDL